MLWGLLFIWIAYTSMSRCLSWVKHQYWRTFPCHYLLRGNLLLVVGWRNKELPLAWFEVNRRVEQNIKMWRTHSCERTKKMDLYHQLLSLGDKTCPPIPHSFSPRFLDFFASFAILFTTQEYTHQAPGGADCMRAEIQCAHYAIKSIVSHHSFLWVVFRVIQMFTWNILGASRQMYDPRKRPQNNPSFPRMEVMTPFWGLFPIAP